MSHRLYTPTNRGGLYQQRARAIPPGPNSQILWTLDEASSPWANYGRAGALNLTATSGTPTPGRAALFGPGVDYNGNSGGTTDSLATANTSVGEAPGSFSMSIWACIWSFNSTFGTIFTKQYRNDGSWTSPYNSVRIGLLDTTTGTWEVYCTVGGVGTGVSITGASDVLRAGRWHLLSLTFEKNSGGSLLRAYLDGSLVGASASLGNNAVVDWGTHGRWCVGGNPQSTGDYMKGRLDDARVDHELFDSVYWKEMYKAGYGFHERPI